MAAKKSDPVTVLRKLAMKHAGVVEALACAGTAAESAAFKTGKKTFLFARPKEMRFKLKDSVPEMTKLAAEDPERYESGLGGWCCVKLGAYGLPPVEQVERWVAESYRLIAGK
jgi:hypothetical protein